MTGPELSRLAEDLGLDVVGAARVAPYDETERHIRERKKRGLFADMRFTMARPEVSCHPERLLDGARSVKMLGRYVPVRAEIVNVPAFSVHADRDEILDWLRSAPHRPEITFVVHGEPAAADALHAAIERELGWTAARRRRRPHGRASRPCPGR